MCPGTHSKWGSDDPSIVVGSGLSVKTYGLQGAAAAYRRLSECHFSADRAPGGSAYNSGGAAGEEYRQKLQLIRLLLVRNRSIVESRGGSGEGVRRSSAALKSIIKMPPPPTTQDAGEIKNKARHESVTLPNHNLKTTSSPVSRKVQRTTQVCALCTQIRSYRNL